MIDRLTSTAALWPDQLRIGRNVVVSGLRVLTPQMKARAVRQTLAGLSLISVLVGGFREFVPLPDPNAYAAAALDSQDACENTLAAMLAKPFSVQIDALPLGTTSVSLQRVRYAPGVELTAQPIDGPRLMLVESGVLTMELARPGATRFPSGSSVDVISLAAGREQQVACGEIVLIPAHVPVQLANTSPAPVVWLQVQAETPPSLCACGEDLTGSDSTLLPSQTLEWPFAAPATLIVARGQTSPQSSSAGVEEGVVQLVTPLDSAVRASTGSGGVTGNNTLTSTPIYTVTLVAASTT